MSGIWYARRAGAETSNLSIPFLNPVTLVGLHALAGHQAAIAKALERLATGKRINRASDDPAGSIIADRMAGDIAELSATIKAGEQARYLFGAAEGGLSVVSDMLTDLQGLTVQAANRGALSAEERKGLQVEAEGIIGAIDYVLGTVSHNGQKVLADGFTANVLGSSYTFAGLSVGALGQGVVPDASLLDLVGPKLNLEDGDMEAAQKVVTAAQEMVTQTRAQFGRYLQYDLGSQLHALRVQHENTVDARSKITDADFAQEISNYFRAQILQQASVRSLQLMNQSAGQTLQLLSM